MYSIIVTLCSTFVFTFTVLNDSLVNQIFIEYLLCLRNFSRAVGTPLAQILSGGWGWMTKCRQRHLFIWACIYVLVQLSFTWCASIKYKICTRGINNDSLETQVMPRERSQVVHLQLCCCYVNRDHGNVPANLSWPTDFEQINSCFTKPETKYAD